jgi:hypothetical protein
MPNFDRVVIKADARHPRNIHLAVHPFRMPGPVAILVAGLYDPPGVPPSKRPLADRLWEGIPGLLALFFSNGKITIQHSGLFPDEEIITAATEIIAPHLEEQLALDRLGRSNGVGQPLPDLDRPGGLAGVRADQPH